MHEGLVMSLPDDSRSFAFPVAQSPGAAIDWRGMLRTMRPLQWSKNAAVGAALVFDRQFFHPAQVGRSLAAILAFCAASSVIYIINDLVDAPKDRCHPEKRRRPIASGRVGPVQALVLAAALLLGALVSAWLIRPEFSAVIIGYVALMIAYTNGLKQAVILDVLIIAAGFVLRAVGGAVAIHAPISPWLYVCTMLLALFLGFGKRRNELAVLGPEAASHRANLGMYTVPLLDQLIGLVSAATLMAYSLYTFDAPNVPADHTMMLTIPFVAYALFRYLYLIHGKGAGGSPEQVLVSDVPLLVCLAGWGLTCAAILTLAS
jgi:4-hydroxybenzoate polyprenyltransferase